MWGTLIRQWNGIAALGLALGCGPHQQFNAAGETGNLGILTCDDLAQIVCQARQMCQSLLELIDSRLVLLVHPVAFR